MALILETGAGLTNANSYADVATATAYFTDRSVMSWGNAAVSEKETALIRATDYIDSNYIFRSVPLHAKQALACPRYAQNNAPVFGAGSSTDYGIPVFDSPDLIDVTQRIKPALVKATIELALLMLTSTDFAAKTRIVASEQSTLSGVGSVMKTYSGRFSDPYPIVTGLLKEIASYRLASGSSSMMTQ